MDSLASNFSSGLGRKSWRGQKGHHGLASIRAGCGMGLAVEQSLCGALCPLRDRDVTAPCTGVGPVHLWVPAAPAGSGIREEEPSCILPLSEVTGCSCHEHCEVGSYCAGLWCGNASCPATGQTSAHHEAGVASLAVCKQMSLPLLAELCSG